MLKPEITIYLYQRRAERLDADIKSIRKELQTISNCPHCQGIRKETNIKLLVSMLQIREKVSNEYKERISMAEDRLEYSRGMTV